LVPDRFLTTREHTKCHRSLTEITETTKIFYKTKKDAATTFSKNKYVNNITDTGVDYKTLVLHSIQ